MSSSLKIDSEFKSLIPPLTTEEYNGLEQDIIRDGCLDPLKIWNDTIIDGHNRYEICQKYNIEFQTKSLDFETRIDAIIWIIDHQLDRRNISLYARGVLILKKKSEVEKKAKENQSLSQGRGIKGLMNSSNPIEPINTRKQLAEEAKIAEQTLSRIEKIEAVAPEEVKQQVSAGNKSINEAYKEIKKEEKKSDIASSREKRAKDAQEKKTTLQVDFRLGDFRDILSDIPDASVDLMLTDPPYPEEFLPLWEDLSKFAKRVLKPKRFLIAYSGQLHLNKVYELLSKHLDYYWTFTLLHHGGHQLINARNIFCNWKPLLVFQNGIKKIDIPIDDIVKGSGREKDDHDWQQGELELKQLIEQFTVENEIILDPFAGSGTVLSMSKKLNRVSIGAEINEEDYWIAYNKLQLLD